ncbi:MAG TPA: DUF427 domain-containing protein [Thermoleophilaceae bacterium]|nr:DUF427 domain-containing protein [Thermoleophilaceae bacterium]
MSLTHGSGPFGDRPAGRFNRRIDPEGLLYLEESPKWIRARFAGETVADSRNPRILHEHQRLPAFYFPPEDVRMDLLRESGRAETDPVKGERTSYTLEVDGRTAEDAASAFAGEPLIEGLVTLRWDAMDEWLEEEEPLFGHTRDPYSRIDVRDTSRHVRVSIGGETVAESTRAKVLFEAGLPPRWYFPREDVRMELLVDSDRQTTCAYKGFASYWSVGEEDDIAWTYEDPLHDALPVQGLVAFFNERVDLEVDGEPVERPHTQWSRD